MNLLCLTLLACNPQVDVTAEDSKVGPGEIPAVDQAAVKAAEPASGVMGVAQRQFGAGWAVQDPWHAIRAGVAPVKPHKAQVRAACPVHERGGGDTCISCSCKVWVVGRAKQQFRGQSFAFYSGFLCLRSWFLRSWLLTHAHLKPCAVSCMLERGSWIPALYEKEVQVTALQDV